MEALWVGVKRIWFWISCVGNSLLLVWFLWRSPLDTPLSRLLLVGIIAYAAILILICGTDHRRRRKGYLDLGAVPPPIVRVYGHLVTLLRKSFYLFSLLVLTVGSWNALLFGDGASVRSALWSVGVLLWTVFVIVWQLVHLFVLGKRAGGR